MDAEQKYRRLVELLRQTGGALVAFSGGVDSTLLLAAAREALGRRTLAATGRSAIVPEREHEAALQLARQLGVDVQVLETTEMQDPGFRQNPPQRCLLCKRRLFTALKQLAREHGLETVVEGSNADDLNDYRPGMTAGRELDVRAPLAELGLTKAEIRRLARARGLPVWNKPSMACLASRIPYGSEITETRLRRIERAEEAVRSLGFGQVRVRDHGAVARVEVEPDELPRLLAPPVRDEVVVALKEAGYRYVSVDLEGYRTGAMNESLER